MEDGGGGPRASYEWNGRLRWSWLRGRMRRLRATRWMGCTTGRCRGTVGRRERQEGCGGEKWRWRDWQQLALHRASEYGADSARRPTPAFGTRLRAHTCSDVISYLSSLCHPFLACPPVFSPLPVRSAPLLPPPLVLEAFLAVAVAPAHSPGTLASYSDPCDHHNP